MGELKDPLMLGADCAHCPFAKDGKPNRPVFAEGVTDPQAVLVGEGPGADEVEIGRPFVGPTGKELDASLRRAKLARARMLVVNATLCRPPPGGKTEASMQAAVKCCSPAFQKQMEPGKGKPMFIMGKGAWQAIGKIPKGGIQKGRGFIRDWNGVPYIATWHPTFAFFRNPFEWGAFDVDLDRFARLLRGELRPVAVRLAVNPPVSELDELLRSKDPIAVDIETAPEEPSRPWTGKDPTRAALRTIGFGTTTRAMSFVWADLDEGSRDVLRRGIRDAKTIWHNGAWFDHRVLMRYGFSIGQWEDTRELRMALDPVSPLSLAYLASLYDDCRPWKESDEEDDKGLVFTDDMAKLCRYNAQDCVETARVWEGLLNDVAARKDAETVWKLYQAHKRTAAICAKMHTRGIQVHTANRAALDEQLREEFAKRQARLRELVGVADFTASPDSLRALLFRRHRTDGIPCFDLPDPFADERWSSDGTISVDQAHLMEIVCDPRTPPKLVEIIQQYWQTYAVRQARSTFVSSDLIEHAIGVDGRLRPGWNSCGTDTGRKSCSEPNVMNLSKEKD